MMSPLDSALSYAQFGWRVLPVHAPEGTGRCSCGKPACRNIGKHPRVTGGAHAATTNAGKLERWFIRWPSANVGIATGVRSGIIVLDEDPRHGSETTLETLERKHGKLPDTVESLTGSGRHRLFRHPGFTVRNDGAGKLLGPGLDVRGDGGFFVAPPSLHQCGRRYAWELSSLPEDIAVALLPDWITAMLRGSETDRETEETEDTEDTEDTEAIQIASVSPSLCLSVSDAIAMTLPQREGERKRKLFDLARALKAVPSLAGKPLRDLKPVVRQWHAQAVKVMGTKAFDETWAEFSYAWPRARTALGQNPLVAALAVADAASLPPVALDYDSVATQRLIKLCRELQRRIGLDPFFLSCRTAGTLLDIDHDAANKLLNMLISDGLLACTKAGTTRKAARYRYIADQGASPA